MSRPTVLLIGGRDRDIIQTLETTYRLIKAASGREAITQATSSSVQATILDAAAMRTTGTRICRSLRDCSTKTPILHIHPGPPADVDSAADVLLFAPVSARQLMNTLASLLHASSDEIVECGPFRMDLERRVLVAHGRETQLTPKVAHLVEMFLRHPGQTLDRKTLMEEVWDTTYLGDTRTLNVHIRWVRDALENGSAPRYLKTVRGIGYQLDLPEV